MKALPSLDGQFRHLVPPAVRQMQEELKNMLQNILSDNFNKVQTCNANLQKFLGQMSLPMCIQSLQASDDIPDQLWSKIEEFQKKGSEQNFTNSIASNQNFVQINNDVVQSIEQSINEEESIDTNLRQQHNLGQVVPSARVNGPYRQNVDNYKQKMQQA